jgi:hypothetical protein
VRGSLIVVEVQTGVDDLMQLVKDKGRISLSDAAKQLNMPDSTIQAWVDFLVEDHILGIEYKFTTPYIYVHSEERLTELQKEQEQEYTLQDYKKGFFSKAKAKQLPETKILDLWNEHLLYAIKQQKDSFLKECERRGVPEAEDLYQRYVEEVQNAT